MHMIIAWLLLGYLFGSVSSAIVVCRVLGHGDPRLVGSRNPGTTNVLRQFGKGAAALTLIGDVAKGVIPVVASQFWDVEPLGVALAGGGAFLGHLYPIFFRFVGGKGVATLIGVLLAFDIKLGICFIGCWLSIAALTRYSSLSALTATTLTPIVAFYLGTPLPSVVMLGLMGLFVFWRHQSNIRNLLAGTERKIGKSREDGT